MIEQPAELIGVSRRDELLHGFYANEGQLWLCLRKTPVTD